MSFKIFVGPRANLFRPATLVLSACVVAVLGTNLANAAVPPSAPSIVVRYSDLDVATPNGAAKLYRRIASAAQKVCPDADSSRLEDKMATWSCRRQAVNRAVESVNSPEVAGLLKHPRVASTR